LDLSGDYYQKLAQAIVGIKLKIVDIQASFKLSQNKLLEDKNKVIGALKAKGDPQSIKLADLISRFSKEVI
jgi:predicted FMN-binding regulatory protein PaiB